MDVSVVRTSLDGREEEVETLLEAYHAAANERGAEWFDDEDFGWAASEAVAADLDRLESEPIDDPLFLAVDGDDAFGTVQLKELDRTTAEVKRLYVEPSARGSGIGRRLVERVLDGTTADGFETLRLGVAPYHERAQALYRGLGFEFTPPYEGSNCPEWLHDDWNFMAYSHSE